MAKTKKQAKQATKKQVKQNVVPINGAVRQALGKAFVKGLVHWSGARYKLHGGPRNAVVGLVRIKDNGFVFRMRIRQPVGVVKEVLGRHAKDWKAGKRSYFRFVGDPKSLAKQVAAMLEYQTSARQSKSA